MEALKLTCHCHHLILDLVGSFHVVTVAVTAGVVTILLLVALCLSIKHQHYEQRPTTVINEGK